MVEGRQHRRSIAAGITRESPFSATVAAMQSTVFVKKIGQHLNFLLLVFDIIFFNIMFLLCNKKNKHDLNVLKKCFSLPFYAPHTRPNLL